MLVENQLKNQIAEAKELLSAVKEKVEARILYENCPLCKSDKIIKSVIGDCSKQRSIQSNNTNKNAMDGL